MRERAEAGVLLFEVMKLLKTKHGIAVKCERARHEPRLSLHKKRVLIGTLFLWKKDKEAKKPKQKWTESTHTKASLTSALGEE